MEPKPCNKMFPPSYERRWPKSAPARERFEAAVAAGASEEEIVALAADYRSAVRADEREQRSQLL